MSLHFSLNLDLASLCFSRGHVAVVLAWSMRQAGLAVRCLASRRSAWPRGALSGIATLCVACGMWYVVAIVVSFVLVRVFQFHHKSQLFHRLSA